MANKIVVVQGGLYGSEAKGAVALALCERLGIKYACRTGSVNAGHSIWWGDKKLVFQQLPTASVLPNVVSVIGPGAYVSDKIVEQEVQQADCKDRLIFDRNCGVHLDEYADQARQAARSVKIGATQKGSAEAIVKKIEDRGIGVPLLFREEESAGKYRFEDTAELLNDAYDRGDGILLEGTQGTLLDFHCGPYPFVTSRQTIASAWVTEAGLSPALNYEVCLVVRTFPIRVAGNSGPMGTEITWLKLARTMNARMLDKGLPPVVDKAALYEFEHCLRHVENNEIFNNDKERLLYANTKALARMSEEGRAEVLKLFEATTVTKRLRRVAELDVDQLKLTVKKERPAYLALTFLNYRFPELAPQHNPKRLLHDEAKKYVDDLQEKIGCLVKYTSIGPRSEDLLEFWHV